MITRKTLTARVARAFGNDMVLENDELERRLAGRSITDMCSEACRLRKEIRELRDIVRYKEVELDLVDNEIIVWSEDDEK